MNKQNQTKNISLVSRKKSPTPTKSTQNQVSFKNIQAKSFYRNNTELSMSPISSKRLKTNTFRECSIVQTEASDSLANSHPNNVLEAFRIERESLLNALKMYKEQAEALSQQQSKSKKEVHKLKAVIKDKDESISDHVKRNAELTRKVYEYENMLPKLIELEQLQEKIIHENNGLKSKIKVGEGLLSNVASIAKCQDPRSPALDKILALTQPYLTSKKSKEK